MTGRDARFPSAHRGRAFLTLVMFLLVVAACGQPTTQDTSAANMMPNLSSYTANDTTDLQNVIAKVAGGTSLISGNPELAAAVTVINGLASCYQKAGAFQARSYVSNADVTKAGVVIIINRNVISDPNLFTSCVLPRAAVAPQPTALQPCAKAYVYSANNNQYYIGYVATNSDVCQAFCSALPSCTP